MIMGLKRTKNFAEKTFIIVIDRRVIEGIVQKSIGRQDWFGLMPM